MPPPFPVSDHCDGQRFFNPGAHINRDWWDVLRWRLTSRGQPWESTIEIAPQSPPPKPQGEGLTCTWINHATTLLRSQTTSWIIVEDSPLGVQAGIAAGMQVLGYAETGNGSELAELGATVFHSMNELPALLSK